MVSSDYFNEVNSISRWTRKAKTLLTTAGTCLILSTSLLAAPQASPAYARSQKEVDDFLVRSFQERAPIDTTHLERKWLDIPYAHVSQAEKLDIYLPNKGIGPFPIIVAIHGGSFYMGDKRDFQIAPILEAVDQGYAVVSINYRLTGEAKFPAQVHDVKAAIRWIRANSKQYLLNPSKIALWGDSAGGYLSAIAGTSTGNKALEDPTLGNPNQSCEVSAIVDWYGPIDFSTMTGIKRMEGVGVRLFGKSVNEAPDLYALSNPETHLTRNAPPVLIQHGAQDRLIPHEQSTHFAEEYRKTVGHDKVVLDVFPGADHLDEQFNTPQNVQRVIHFLNQYLK
jgi:acetyl esterase/lipase